MRSPTCLGVAARKLVLVTSLLAGGILHAADPVAEGPVIELPKFVVTDSRELPPPESWRYATIPGFEILSSASDRTTKRLVRDFQMFREALDIIWPMPAKMNTPVALILCSKGPQFGPFLPDKLKSGPETATVSVSLKGHNQSAIVIDLASSVINLTSLDMDVTNTSSGVDPTQFSVEHNKQLYREYVRYLLSKSEPRLPAWFEEGMAQIIMAMQFTPGWIEFGKVEDPNTVSAAAGMVAQANASMAQAASAAGDDPTSDASVLAGAPAEDRDFNAALQRRALMSMDKLFAVSHEAPEAANPLGNNTWAKQCYAFVHMCLYGEQGKWRKPFSEFLFRSTQQPVTEALFKECFKMSYKDMTMQLRGYIQFTSYKSLIVRAKDHHDFLKASDVTLRDATPAEVGRIKGRAMILAGHIDAARTELIAPYIRGERDPQLLAALGEIERMGNKDDRARKFLAAAVAGKTTDPEAYLTLARYRFADAEAAATAAKKPFSLEQVQEIGQLLVAARRLPPASPATYELFADTWAHCVARPQRQEITILVEGVQLFPRDLRLVYVTAALAGDAGMADTALSLVEHGLKVAADPATKARFEHLKTVLPPVPAAPTTAPTTVAPKADKSS